MPTETPPAPSNDSAERASVPEVDSVVLLTPYALKVLAPPLMTTEPAEMPTLTSPTPSNDNAEAFPVLDVLNVVLETAYMESC